ncbi:MAG: prepilin peptidase [Caulobacteraceae bacterium]|nr:prepilin peptidase [Caulobacteraceae bacterium]
MSSTLPATALAVIALVASGLALAWSAVSDIRSFQIPNTASAVILLSYVVFAFCVPSAPRLGALGVGLAVFALALVLFVRGSMGGGDVKLLAAASVWSGPHLLAAFAIVTGLVGALLAAFLMSPLGRVMPRMPRDVAEGAGLGALRQPMPFGFAIAAGGLFVLSQQSSLIH